MADDYMFIFIKVWFGCGLVGVKFYPQPKGRDCLVREIESL
jgi:hypothetical protein